MELKSKVTKIYDFKEVDLSKLILPFEVDEEQLEKDINLLIKQHSQMIEAEQVEKGDFATICCKSEEKKFNKEKVTLKVGRGLYNKELEAAVIGMKTGEVKDIMVGELPVTVEILKVERMELPELSDENVAKWGIEGAATVDELKQLYIDRQHVEDTDQTVEDVTAFVQSAAVARSEFQLDPDEEKRKIQDGKNLVKQMLEAYGMGPESDEAAEMEERLIDVCLEELKACAIGCALMAENNVEMTEADYEAAIEKEIREMNVTREEVLEYLPLESFKMQFPAEYYRSLIADHVREYIIENNM